MNLFKFCLFKVFLNPVQTQCISSVVINEYSIRINIFKCLRLQSHRSYLFFWGGNTFRLLKSVTDFCCTLLKQGFLFKLKVFLCC